MYEVGVKASFSSAHFLRDFSGPCENLHGHNWRVEAFFAAEKLDGKGMVIDFAVAEGELKKIIARFDHHLLNEVSPFDNLNPTAENLAKWIFDELAGNLLVRPSKVTVYETDDCFASYF